MEAVLDNFYAYLTDHLLGILASLAGVGVLTMSIVQIIKPWLRPIWTGIHFHKRFSPPESKRGSQGVNNGTSERAVIQAFGITAAVFSLEPPELVNYLRRRVENLIAYCSIDTNRSALQRLGSRVQDGALIKADLDLIIAKPEQAQKQGETPDPVRMVVDAKARLRDAIFIELSLYQLSLEQSWRFILQFLSFLISALIITVAFALFGCLNSMRDFTFAVIGIVGGAILAPFARDLAAAVETARGTRPRA